MRKFQRTTLIAAFCLSVLGGLGLARKVSFIPSIWLLSLLPLLLLLKRKSIVSLFFILLLGAGVGLWRGGGFMQNVYQLRSYTGQKVTIQAKATSDAVYSTRSQI